MSHSSITTPSPSRKSRNAHKASTTTFMPSPRRKRVVFDSGQLERLRSRYRSDPWPEDRELINLAANIKSLPTRVFEWFAQQRALSVGFPSGYLIANLPTDLPRDHKAWRLLAAEFGDEEYRANEIARIQGDTTIYAALMRREGVHFVLPDVEGKFRELRTGVTTMQEPLQPFIPMPFQPEFISVEDDPPQPQNEEADVEINELLAKYLKNLDTLPSLADTLPIIQMNGYRMQGNIILVD